MSANQARIELFIDILDLRNQRALALANITPPELVEAILQEFRELEYLSNSQVNYRLLKAGDRSPLDNEAPLDKQLTGNERLLLTENDVPLPKNAKRPTKHIYLREQGTDKVYKLHWQPAVIGRIDPRQTHNEWIAVDLALHEMGPRVSRRHIQITEENGQYYAEGLSQNPTTINDHQGNTRPLNSQKQPLHHGDVLYLENSQIALKCIVRDKEFGA